MHRTQILLEDWQYQTLRSRAEQEGRSISDLVREILQAALAKSPRRKRKLDSISGIGEDAVAYGKDHDRFLYGDKAED
jgi:plasmid stability protein